MGSSASTRIWVGISCSVCDEVYEKYEPMLEDMDYAFTEEEHGFQLNYITVVGGVIGIGHEIYYEDWDSSVEKVCLTTLAAEAERIKWIMKRHLNEEEVGVYITPNFN